MNFKTLLISDEMKEKAYLRAKSEGPYKNSFTNGDRRMLGFLGEQVFQYLRPQAINSNHKSYDFEVNGKKIEVKTRVMYHEPTGEDDVSVHFNQDPRYYQADYFAFIGMAKDLSKCWLLGWISKNDFLARSYFVPKGTKITARFVAQHDNNAIKLRDLSRLT